MDLVFEHFWALGVLVSLYNGWYLSQQSRAVEDATPQTLAVHRQFAVGIALSGVLAFGAMGVCVLTGLLDTMFDAFRPVHGGPAAWACLGTFLVPPVAYSIWIRRPGVAEALARHPRVQRMFLTSPRALRLIGLLPIPFYFAWLAGLYAMDVASAGQ